MNWHSVAGYESLRILILGGTSSWRAILSVELIKVTDKYSTVFIAVSRTS